MNDKSRQNVGRRQIFAGAATAGALATAASLLPTDKADPQPAPAAGEKDGGEKGGYRLTAHIQRYYDTARV